MSGDNQLATRGRGNLAASFECTERGVTLRLDDARAAEFWAEVEIPYTTLWVMLSAVEEKNSAREAIEGKKRGTDSERFR